MPAADVRLYDPSQPRDASGRWGDGSGADSIQPYNYKLDPLAEPAPGGVRPTFTPDEGGTLFHGTAMPDNIEYLDGGKDNALYLTDDYGAAITYADNAHLGGSGGGTPRVVEVPLTEGKLADVDALVQDEVMNGDGNLGRIYDMARDQGYDYAFFLHPHASDREAQVIVALNAEDQVGSIYRGWNINNDRVWRRPREDRRLANGKKLYEGQPRDELGRFGTGGFAHADGDNPLGLSQRASFATEAAKHDTFESYMDSMTSVYHGGPVAIDEVDAELLNTNDPGFFGKGFYVARDPQDTEHYSSAENRPDGTPGATTEFKIAPDAKILSMASMGTPAGRPLQSDVREWYVESQVASGVPRSEAKTEVQSFDTSADLEVMNDYAEARGYDVVEWYPSEIVVKNLDAIETPDDLRVIYDQAHGTKLQDNPARHLRLVDLPTDELEGLKSKIEVALADVGEMRWHRDLTEAERNVDFVKLAGKYDTTEAKVAAAAVPVIAKQRTRIKEQVQQVVKAAKANKGATLSGDLAKTIDPGYQGAYISALQAEVEPAYRYGKQSVRQEAGSTKKAAEDKGLNAQLRQAIEQAARQAMQRLAARAASIAFDALLGLIGGDSWGEVDEGGIAGLVDGTLGDMAPKIAKEGAGYLTGRAINAGRKDAAAEFEFGTAMWSALLDSRTCPLCKYLDGMYISTDDPDYDIFTPGQLHPWDRCIWVLIGKDDPDSGKETWETPPLDLILSNAPYLEWAAHL